jgi:Rps23 Pro-64 3,4-dihydroxylase Tpa1-like proline 4-hydroxylase
VVTLYHSNHVDAPENESRLTIQMYLNDHGVDFSGGELIWFSSDMEPRMTYLPKAGT